jgi:hypothetical protein
MKEVQPNCVPLSIMNAWTWEQQRGEEVRIAVTHIKPGIDHAQAQAKIKGMWTFLTELWTGRHLEVVPAHNHFPVMPYRYMGLDEWIQEQRKFRSKKR